MRDTGLIVWSVVAVTLGVGVGLTILAAAGWAYRTWRRAHVSYERRLRAAVARHPAGRNR
jgi:hypothetical protein